MLLSTPFTSTSSISTNRRKGIWDNPYYVASCEEIVAVTDGATLDELLDNIREMIALHLEGEDTMATFGLTLNPQIDVRMTVPLHAQTA